MTDEGKYLVLHVFNDLEEIFYLYLRKDMLFSGNKH